MKHLALIAFFATPVMADNTIIKDYKQNTIIMD